MDKIDQVKECISLEVVLVGGLRYAYEMRLTISMCEQVSKLWRTVRQLSELALEDVPFGDEHDLRGRAREVSSFWSSRWSSQVGSD
jgi:hypothetical protein